MNLDKIVKIIWLVCGIGLLIVFLTLGFFALGLDSFFSRRPKPEPRGLAIDNATQQGLTKTKLEISTNQLIDLLNSPNYILPVNISYEQRHETLGGGFSKSYDKEYELYEPSNLIFLDAQFQVINTLLDKKALIISFSYPFDNEYEGSEEVSFKGMDYILCEIVFEDSNKNGQLDEGDDSDLYMANLDGAGLTQITTGLYVDNYEFFDDYQTILIHVKTKEDKIVYYKYLVKEQKLIALSSIEEALKQVETILTK